MLGGRDGACGYNPSSELHLPKLKVLLFIAGHSFLRQGGVLHSPVSLSGPHHLLLQGDHPEGGHGGAGAHVLAKGIYILYSQSQSVLRKNLTTSSCVHHELKFLKR